MLDALGDACDPIDVCGADRAVCAEREFGESYDDIAREVSGSYPAFFCGLPDDEPSCVPARVGEFSGEVTADDADGDGIADADDNCPSVFNAVRPIDGGVQPDADGDGSGDPCDMTPLPTDIDGDGCANSGDNCPFDPNEDQADGDADGKGTVCDPCDDEPNPDGVCPPAPSDVVTIGQIQEFYDDWEGEVVRVEDVVVTGVGEAGYTLQDPSGAAAWSGVYVYEGDAPAVSRGDTVTVEGRVGDYFGETQLSDVAVIASSPGGVVEPTPVTVSEAATEEYEGVLVTLTDGSVTDAAYDCGPPSGGICDDPGLWEIDGEDGVVVFDRLYEDADWETHIGSLPVTGVMNYRWDRRRIMPRTAGDF